MTYEIGITSACNLKCPSCCMLNNIVNTHHDDMTVSEVENILDQIKNCDRDVHTIRVLGGEPTLHPACYDICSLIKDRFPNIKRRQIETNLHDPELTSRIIDKLGFERVNYMKKDDQKSLSQWKLDNHLYLYLSPKEMGMPLSNPVNCKGLSNDCGVHIHKVNGRIGWAWCGWGFSIARLLRRVDFIKPTLFDLKCDGFDEYAVEICCHCVRNIAQHMPKLLARNVKGEHVSECFKQGLEELREYNKTVNNK